MQYRSLSFHRATIPDPELVERGVQVGFNDITFQTELGGTVKAAERFKEQAHDEGYFELADEHDMTTTLWAHEFDNYDESWGPIALDNPTLWDNLSERYEHLVTDLVPEIDYLALTIVESDYWATDTPLVQKLVETIHDACHSGNTDLIFRTFVRKPEEMRTVSEAIPSFRDDVIVMNKFIPQDWYIRNIDHPLIGDVGDRPEFVEIDLANEYARLGHLANCFTEEIAERFEYWEENDVDGVAARVYRDNSVYREGLPEDRRSAWRHDVLNEPEEANLWALGYLASGKSSSLDKIWREYAEHTFGEAADTMKDILRPTGEVVEEALFVEDLNFGTVKWNGVSRARTEEGRTPAHRSMNGFWLHSIFAQERSDDAAASQLMINPFARKTSRWFWDESYEPTYHQIRKGHPEIIARKEAAYEEARETAERSISLIRTVADELPAGQYELLEFKLEENLFNLIAMCEMELAWLKASNRIYFCDMPEEAESMLSEVKSHLATLEELIPRYEESVEAEWQGDVYYKERGEYIDIIGFLHEFRRHWQLDDFDLFSDAFADDDG